MSEIKYAITQLEKRADAVSSIGEFEEYNALTTALTVLRTELEREKNEPLTEGELSEMVDKPIFIVFESPIDTIITRKWSIPYMVENGTAHCTDGENWYPAPNCHIYRYEPKGESK